MNQFILQELTLEERSAMLAEKKNSENVTYDRVLTEAEIDNESKNLANKVKELAAIEEEKKEVNKAYKDRIDTCRDTMDRISKTLLGGRKTVTEKCFKVINIEGREVGYYNVSGELVKVRPLIDDDLQMDMFEQHEPAALESHNVEDAESQEVDDTDLEEAQLYYNS